MGTAVTVTGIIVGGLVLLVLLVIRSDNKGAKLQARHSDVKKAKERLAVARNGLNQVEDHVLSLEALDPAMATGVLKIIRDTRKELENSE